MRLENLKIGELILGIFLAFLFFFVFKSWFSFGLITAGDWGFAYPEAIRSSALVPFSWSSLRNLGANSLSNSTLWLGSYCRLTAFIFNQIFKIPWPVAEKLIWPWPFLILTIFSPWYLAKTIFPKNKIVHFFAPFIYLFNTYILMIVGGGQMGIGLAYSLAPFVFGLFINLINELKSSRVNELKRLVLAGVVLAIQVMFDPRISLLTMGAVFLYAVFRYGLAIKKYIKTFVLPIFVALGLHSYWLLPVILVRKPVLPAGFGKPGWVEFLSFGNFSDSISLLHPNWPENIFGKTYFMRPEFLVIPIISFVSLLFTRINTNKAATKRNLSPKSGWAASRINANNILFFALLALIGAFLAKGSKPPFGGVYLWLFKYFPGMSMFRDPTKFYPLVALSYSVLIPFSVSEIYTLLSSKFKITVQSSKLQFKVQNYLPGIFLLLVTVYWLLLIKPAILGQLGGTFKTKVLPTEYTVLKDFIHSQEEFFRTFWIPQRQRFGFYSNNHPAIESPKLLSEEELAVRGVKYVIIPFDSEGEIFLEDRKYDHKQRLALEEELDKVSWLKKIDVADKIAVYQTPSYKDHFFIDLLSSSRVNDLPAGEAGLTSWKMINPTKYVVSVKIEQPPATLVFSETYDELWQAKIGDKIIPSTLYNNLNSFSVDQTGNFEIVVEFVAQKYVYWGLVVSGMTLLVCIWYLVSSIL